jgi:SagB-type dehydrogenase family enzyme
METATQVLHRLTSYEPGREWDVPIDDPRIRQDLVVNDIARLPWFFKRYPEPQPRLALPRDLPTTTATAVDVLAGIAVVPLGTLDLAALARLLYLCSGVVRTTERPYGTYLFRAAGSAGGRFPLEVYVAVPDGSTLPAGVHWYDPLDHVLVQVGPTPRGDAPAIVVTGVPWRTGWRYAERGYRHIYWDAGTMTAQLLVAADSAGLTARLVTRFPDADVASLVGADRLHEFPVAVIGLGDGVLALDATGPAACGDVDAEPEELPLATAAHRAGDLDSLGEPWSRGAPVRVTEHGHAPVEEVVLARGSQRRMDPSRGVPGVLLRTCLDVALRGIDLTHYVVVHDVHGLAPGIYRWPDLDEPTTSGDLREELFRICLDQALGRDAAFVVIAVTDVSALDDRGYREAQYAAGIVEGRLHLLAYGLAASASGMTFLDSEVPALVGADIDALLFTCVGVPDYRSAPGGRPGEPTKIRTVVAR